jgi:hypothetical protein
MEILKQKIAELMALTYLIKNVAFDKRLLDVWLKLSVEILSQIIEMLSNKSDDNLKVDNK